MMLGLGDDAARVVKLPLSDYLGDTYFIEPLLWRGWGGLPSLRGLGESLFSEGVGGVSG